MSEPGRPNKRRKMNDFLDEDDPDPAPEEVLDPTDDLSEEQDVLWREKDALIAENDSIARGNESMRWLLVSRRSRSSSLLPPPSSLLR